MGELPEGRLTFRFSVMGIDNCLATDRSIMAEPSAAPKAPLCKGSCQKSQIFD